MQRPRSQLLLTLSIFACAFFFCMGTSLGGKVAFPSDNPAFTVEFPSGWTYASDKDGNLNCNPHDDSGWAFTIVQLTDVRTEKELKAALPELVKGMKSGANLTNFKTGDFDETENGGGVVFIGLRGKGKADAVPFIVMVNGFESQKGRFFAFVTAGSEESDKKHANEYERIASSIEPVKSGSKRQSAESKPPGKEETSAVDGPSSAQDADYLIAPDSNSPDGKFAVMIPKVKLCPDEPKKGAANKCKDYVVALKPFQVLTALDSEYPEFENKNHGGMHVAWAKDSSAVLVTLDQKWGPNEIFLCEIADGKVTRSTNLLMKVRDALVADCKKAIPDRAGDCSAFVFVSEDETPACQFSGSSEARLRVTAATDPKESPGRKQWVGVAEATWDIPKAELTSQKVIRKFAGVRKD